MKNEQIERHGKLPETKRYVIVAKDLTIEFLTPSPSKRQSESPNQTVWA